MDVHNAHDAPPTHTHLRVVQVLWVVDQRDVALRQAQAEQRAQRGVVAGGEGGHHDVVVLVEVLEEALKLAAGCWGPEQGGIMGAKSRSPQCCRIASVFSNPLTCDAEPERVSRASAAVGRQSLAQARPALTACRYSSSPAAPRCNQALQQAGTAHVAAGGCLWTVPPPPPSAPRAPLTGSPSRNTG